MRQKNNIKIDVLLADCDKVSTQSISSVPGRSVAEIMALLNNELKHAWLDSGAISINAERVNEEQVLNEDTKILILRRLINDPKDLRRQRAKLTLNKKVK